MPDDLRLWYYFECFQNRGPNLSIYGHVTLEDYIAWTRDQTKYRGRVTLAKNTFLKHAISPRPLEDMPLIDIVMELNDAKADLFRDRRMGIIHVVAIEGGYVHTEETSDDIPMEAPRCMSCYADSFDSLKKKYIPQVKEHMQLMGAGWKKT